MVFLYNISVRFIYFFIKIAAILNNSKAKFWIEGRKDVFKFLNAQNFENESIIWIHAASLGEFEQGRPLIERIKKESPQYKILLTFYSPSGYEIRKNYAYADYICYLPLDTASNAKRLLDIVNPKSVIFIKYEFWYHFLNEATKRKIPTIYIAALFWESMSYFQWYLSFFIPIFKKITHYYVQNEASKIALLNNVFNNQKSQISVVGDPRIDRVLQIAKEAKDFPLIEAFCNGKKTLIAGSTWEKDDLILKSLIGNRKDWCFIVASHDISEKRLQFIENQLDSSRVVRYSNLGTDGFQDKNILLIDNIGMLSSIYRYGKLAYIGGGFGSGIHNTLEPMAFGLPVIFGKKYQQFEEAKAMIEQNAAFSIENGNELISIFQKLENIEMYQAANSKIMNYMNQNKGATEKIQFIF